MYNNNMVQVIKYVLYQLALALKYIKSMDVAHRDIKVVYGWCRYKFSDI